MVLHRKLPAKPRGTIKKATISMFDTCIHLKHFGLIYRFTLSTETRPLLFFILCSINTMLCTLNRMGRWEQPKLTYQVQNYRSG